LKIVFVARFEIQKSWRTSSAAGTVHHPSVRNNVFGYRLFNFQDSVNHSLCILIRRIFSNLSNRITGKKSIHYMVSNAYINCTIKVTTNLKKCDIINTGHR